MECTLEAGAVAKNATKALWQESNLCHCDSSLILVALHWCSAERSTSVESLYRAADIYGAQF